VKHFREQFSLNIHCQRQRTAFPVAGNQCIQRLFHLFQAAQAVFRVTVKAGNALATVVLIRLFPVSRRRKVRTCGIWQT
jgi:hypothetical protein